MVPLKLPALLKPLRARNISLPASSLFSPAPSTRRARKHAASLPLAGGDRGSAGASCIARSNPTLVKMRFQVQLLVAALLLGAVSALDVLQVLQPFPDFSSFVQLLNSTEVASEIDQQNSVALFVVSNGGVGGLSGSGLTSSEVADVLRYHSALQAFSYDEIRNLPNKTTEVATLYQSTGRAQGLFGYINITDQADGSVGLGVPGGNTPNATIVTNITQQGYNISVFQVSNFIFPVGLQQAALTNITEALVQGGKYNTLLSLLKQYSLESAVQELAATGLTLFAPTDLAFNEVQSTLATLTADQATLVLKFHVLSKYLSQAQLQQDNGEETTISTYSLFVSTIAGQVVLQGGINNATVQTTVTDKNPAAIYAIDSVLIPPALFAPAPAPGPLAPSPAVEGPAPVSPIPAPVEGPAPASPIPAPGTAPVPSPASSSPSPSSPLPSGTPVPSVAPTTPVPAPPILPPTPTPGRAPTPSSTPPTSPSKSPTPSRGPSAAPPPQTPAGNAAAGLVVSVAGVVSATLVASGLLLL